MTAATWALFASEEGPERRPLENPRASIDLRQNSPRCFQRGPKWFGAQMHRAILARQSQNAMPLPASLIYPLLRLFRKVNATPTVLLARRSDAID
jgi:hypothetical protein